MSWKEKVKDFGGGDLAFLSMDGEVICFVVVGEPILLQGRYKGKPSEKIGAPIVTTDGFQLFIMGKRLFRQLAKCEEQFPIAAFMAIRHGEQGDIESTYELKVLDDVDLTKQLLNEIAGRDYANDIDEAINAAKQVMAA